MSYEYNPKSNVVFGDVDLSDYNAYAVYCNIFDRPERDISVVSVPGRNGDLIFDNGRYKNVDRTYQIHVVGVENVHNLIRDLTSTIGYQRLEDEYDPNVYMMARLKSKPNVRKFVGNAVLITVTFDRMPQRWDKNETIGASERRINVIYSDASGTTERAVYAFLRNDTNENLKTIFKFHVDLFTEQDETVQYWLNVFIRDTMAEEYGTRGVYITEFYDKVDSNYIPKKDIFFMRLYFNNNHYTESRQVNIVLDSENQVVYDDDTKENLNDCIKTFNRFPELIPGNNHIYVLGERKTYSSDSNLTSYDVLSRKWII